ncbi:MAG: acetyl-CoA C-acyltransferase, partial [Alphaproteobacteria bacterium]|nr:acetyl-CoA C-acyltransferase [Alphaproteobacteria bacterium]
MDQAVILSTARTPITKAYRGSFNDTDAPTLASHAIKASIKKSGLDPNEIEDVIMGAAIQQGTQGYNIGRLSAIASELPTHVPGMSV